MISSFEESHACHHISEICSYILSHLLPTLSAPSPTYSFSSSSLLLTPVCADLRGDVIFVFGLRVRESTRGQGIAKLLMVGCRPDGSSPRLNKDGYLFIKTRLWSSEYLEVSVRAPQGFFFPACQAMHPCMPGTHALQRMHMYSSFFLS